MNPAVLLCRAFAETADPLGHKKQEVWGSGTPGWSVSGTRTWLPPRLSLNGTGPRPFAFSVSLLFRGVLYQKLTAAPGSSTRSSETEFVQQGRENGQRADVDEGGGGRTAIPGAIPSNRVDSRSGCTMACANG
jgi:hypothetical protein